MNDTGEPPVEVDAEDCQIPTLAVKFLNGKGKGAQIVAYYPAHRVSCVEQAK